MLAAYVVLLTGLLLTALVTLLIADALVTADRARFERQTHRIDGEVAGRIDEYIGALRATEGLFQVEHNVSRAEWHSFVAALAIERHYPGISGLAYAPRVSAAEHDAHIAAVRAQGVPNYTITPPGERPEYFPVVYREPANAQGQRVLGYDGFADPVRRAAMEQARDTGQPTATGKVVLASDQGRTAEPSFLIYYPIYQPGAPVDTVDERRAALQGFVAAGFRVNALMAGIFGADTTPDIDFAVYDGATTAPDHLLYDDALAHTTNPTYYARFTQTSTIVVAGRRWTIQYATRPDFVPPAEQWEPWAFAAGGTLVSFLLFGLIWLLLSGRWRAQVDLRHSEERLQTVVANLPVVLNAFDRQGTITLCEGQGLTQLGRQPGESVGKAVAEVYCDQPQVGDNARRALAGEAFTTTMALAGRVLEARYAPLRDELGAIIGGIGIAVDITERKRAEEALRASEARHRLLMQHSLEAIYFFELATKRVVDCNDAFLQFLGYTAEEARVLTIYDFVDHPRADIDRFMEPIYTVGSLPSADRRWRRKDGSFLDVQVSAATLEYEGRALGFFIARDITEQKRAEAALRASEARHRAVVDSAFDAIITVTAAGVIQDYNRGAERIFGYTATEATGQPFTLLLPGRLHALYLEGLQRSLTQDESWMLGQTLELVGRRKDGSEFPLEASITEVRGGPEPLFTGILRDISERKAFEQELHHQAFHDPLTGLPNRALFLERLQHALARASRRPERVAVLFLDLDRFKVVNDSLGHAAGDELLVAVTRRLQHCVRPEDTVARLGGDEFTILLEDVADTRDATLVAERVITRLQAPIAIGNREVFISTSIGIVLSTPDEDRPTDLMRDVDVALYRAKARGKGYYEVFDTTMNARALERLELESELRHAIERGELRVYYQPKVALATGAITGTEALARWEHPQRGLLTPAAFIPLAEETGLIRPLGRWILAEACRQTRVWHERHPDEPPLLLCVNLSARQFQQPDLVEEVAAVLRDTGLPPHCLKLEITESVLMEEFETSRATLWRLKRLGVQLALDDFGTGYSSLSYLKSFPVDALKIDKAFIDRLGQAPEDTAIVQAVITLAHTLGMLVIAEGVETAAQVAQLRALGCDQVQGYYFAKPLPPASFDALLNEGPFAIASNPVQAASAVG